MTVAEPFGLGRGRHGWAVQEPGHRSGGRREAVLSPQGANPERAEHGDGKQGVALGIRTVLEAMQNPEIAGWLEAMLFEEIVPTLAGRVDGPEAFARQTLERFRNPFLEHKIKDILAYHPEKVQIRLARRVQSMCGSLVRRRGDWTRRWRWPRRWANEIVWCGNRLVGRISLSAPQCRWREHGQGWCRRIRKSALRRQPRAELLGENLASGGAGGSEIRPTKQPPYEDSRNHRCSGAAGGIPPSPGHSIRRRTFRARADRAHRHLSTSISNQPRFLERAGHLGHAGRRTPSICARNSCVSGN